MLESRIEGLFFGFLSGRDRLRFSLNLSLGKSGTEALLADLYLFIHFRQFCLLFPLVAISLECLSHDLVQIYRYVNFIRVLCFIDIFLISRCNYLIHFEISLRVWYHSHWLIHFWRDLTICGRISRQICPFVSIFRSGHVSIQTSQ